MHREEMMRSMFLAGRVKRYHTWPVLHQETVMEHAGQVAIIYWQVFGLPQAAVLIHLLTHDHAELHTGDLPFPVKTQNPSLAGEIDIVERRARNVLCLPVNGFELDAKEIKRCKICDLLQMWQFGNAELRMGNQYAEDIIADMSRAARDLAVANRDEREVIAWMAGQGAV